MTEEKHDHSLQEEGHYITLIDEEGNEDLYAIMLTFSSDEFEKDYVIVYPANANLDEEVELSAFSYSEAEGGLEGRLYPIEEDKEWDMIEEVIGAFVAEDEE